VTPERAIEEVGAEIGVNKSDLVARPLSYLRYSILPPKVLEDAVTIEDESTGSFWHVVASHEDLAELAKAYVLYTLRNTPGEVLSNLPTPLKSHLKNFIDLSQLKNLLAQTMRDEVDAFVAQEARSPARFWQTWQSFGLPARGRANRFRPSEQDRARLAGAIALAWNDWIRRDPFDYLEQGRPQRRSPDVLAEAVMIVSRWGDARLKEMAEEMVKWMGPGHFLARYDRKVWETPDSGFIFWRAR
jgi:hypothetical protein